MRSGLVNVVRLVWWAAALLASGCASQQKPAPAPDLNRLDSFDDRGQEALQRGHNLSKLHPTVRDLLSAHEAEHLFIQHGVVDLPLDSCELAVSFVAPKTHECSLVALAAGRGAVLVISRSGECAGGDCMEHSWAFLEVYTQPFALPARRASDYQALRQDLSREDASALWLAGFRGRSEATRFVQAEPGATPRIVSYQSCSLAPDGRELVCRSAEGHVLGLDPITSRQRLIARLGADFSESPVWWTHEGKLAVAAGFGEHALCTDRCPLAALLDWPSTGEAPQLVPAALAR